MGRLCVCVGGLGWEDGDAGRQPSAVFAFRQTPSPFLYGSEVRIRRLKLLKTFDATCKRSVRAGDRRCCHWLHVRPATRKEEKNKEERKKKKKTCTLCHDAATATFADWRARWRWMGRGIIRFIYACMGLSVLGPKGSGLFRSVVAPSLSPSPPENKRASVALQDEDWQQQHSASATMLWML